MDQAARTRHAATHDSNVPHWATAVATALVVAALGTMVLAQQAGGAPLFTVGARPAVTEGLIDACANVMGVNTLSKVNVTGSSAWYLGHDDFEVRLVAPMTGHPVAACHVDGADDYFIVTPH